MTHAISWNCPSCKRAGKLVPASLGEPAFWICVNTDCMNTPRAPMPDDSTGDEMKKTATDSPAEREQLYTEQREDDIWRAIRACYGAIGARDIRAELLSIRTNRAASVPVEDQ